jgi:hypothetical protein
MFVVFDNQYADGKDGQKYGGFEANGHSDSKGRYSSTWVVAPTAPLGPVRLDLAVAGKINGQGRTATRQIAWRVAASC